MMTYFGRMKPSALFKNRNTKLQKKNAVKQLIKDWGFLDIWKSLKLKDIQIKGQPVMRIATKIIRNKLGLSKRVTTQNIIDIGKMRKAGTLLQDAIDAVLSKKRKSTSPSESENTAKRLATENSRKQKQTRNNDDSSPPGESKSSGQEMSDDSSSAESEYRETDQEMSDDSSSAESETNDPDTDQEMSDDPSTNDPSTITRYVTYFLNFYSLEDYQKKRFWRYFRLQPPITEKSISDQIKAAVTYIIEAEQRITSLNPDDQELFWRYFKLHSKSLEDPIKRALIKIERTHRMNTIDDYIFVEQTLKKLSATYDEENYVWNNLQPTGNILLQIDALIKQFQDWQTLEWHSVSPDLRSALKKMYGRKYKKVNIDKIQNLIQQYINSGTTENMYERAITEVALQDDSTKKYVDNIKNRFQLNEIDAFKLYNRVDRVPPNIKKKNVKQWLENMLLLEIEKKGDGIVFEKQTAEQNLGGALFAKNQNIGGVVIPSRRKLRSESSNEFSEERFQAALKEYNLQDTSEARKMVKQFINEYGLTMERAVNEYKIFKQELPAFKGIKEYTDQMKNSQIPKDMLALFGAKKKRKGSRAKKKRKGSSQKRNESQKELESNYEYVTRLLEFVKIAAITNQDVINKFGLSTLKERQETQLEEIENVYRALDANTISKKLENLKSILKSKPVNMDLIRQFLDSVTQFLGKKKIKDVNGNNIELGLTEIKRDDYINVIDKILQVQDGILNVRRALYANTIPKKLENLKQILNGKKNVNLDYIRQFLQSNFKNATNLKIPEDFTEFIDKVLPNMSPLHKQFRSLRLRF